MLGGMIVSVENYVLDLSYKNILSEIKVKSVKMLADL
jgi:F0F1-type ATP synthase delta subunit